MADREGKGPAGPASAYRDPGQAASGASERGLELLRRRRKEGKFNAATKAIGAFVDIGKKMRIENITASLQEAFAGDPRKRQNQPQTNPAPPGVTHAYSAALTHVTAPLWATGSKSLAESDPIVFNDPFVLNFCRSLDAKGWDIELVAEILSQEPVLATVYVCLLLARLLCLENGEWRLNFFELAGQITRDVRHRREYEEQPNDELIAHDQATRRLTEVGGAWRPRGAVELPAPLNAKRQECLQRLMHASVCFRYHYADENLHSLVDALASQLFLVNYSESVVQLVAGVKGPNYIAKYFVHTARAESSPTDGEGYLAEPGVRSTVLEAVNAGIDLAMSNLIHRNDVTDFIVQALVKAIAICPPKQLRSLVKIITETLGLICCVEIQLLVQLLDALRPLMLKPNPLGAEALRAMRVVWLAIRNIGAPSRELMSTLFVAGGDMRSFRRRPAHVLTAPYCARATLVQKVLHADVGMQRGGNPNLPVALERNIDPQTGAAITGMLDDTVLYLANHVTNVFQSALELTSHVSEDDLNATFRAKAAERKKLERAREKASGGDQATQQQQLQQAEAAQLEEESAAQMAQSVGSLQLIDLATLFSLQPMALCGFLPLLHMLLSPRNEDTIFSDPDHTRAETYARIAEQYIVLVDGHKPLKGQRRFRLESPRLPMRPLLLAAVTENDDMMTAVKTVIDKHWKYCDQRITDREPAYLHPKRDLSLSHFIENEIDLVVAGGGGVIRRVCEMLLRLRIQYPGAVPVVRLFIVPTGYDNDLAAWLARRDPLYLHRVYAPLTAMQLTHVDQPSVEALSASAPPSLESLQLRERINGYLVHGTVANHVVLYQVECLNPDGTSVYLTMTCNFEIGAHVTAAVVNDSYTASKDGLCTQPLMISNAGIGTGGKTSSSPRLARTKSNLSFNRAPPEHAVPVTLEQPQLQQLQAIATGFIDQHTTHTFVKLAETMREPAERILARMHAAHRGLPLSTRRHPVEAKDVPFCASGTDVLDWVSTTYHLYDAKQSANAAQALLDRGVITCAAAPPQKPAERFGEAGLYVPRAREEPDTVPLTAPGARSTTYDLAMSMRQSVEEFVPSRAALSSGMPFCPRARIAFVPRSGDPQYIDLTPSASSASSTVSGVAPDARGAVREISALKVKSTGSTGDRGASPDATGCGVELALYDNERKKAATTYAPSALGLSGVTGGGGGVTSPTNPGSPQGPSNSSVASPPGSPSGAGSAGQASGGGTAVHPSNVGTTAELGDHFTLRFGDTNQVDARSVLSIDVVDDGLLSTIPSGGGAGSTAPQGLVGLHCCVDGDIFGPFIGFRIRPSIGGFNDQPASIPVMSFLACSSSKPPQPQQQKK